MIIFRTGFHDNHRSKDVSHNIEKIISFVAIAEGIFNFLLNRSGGVCIKGNSLKGS